jgi:DNA-binding NtrC family response regulator
VERGAFREDLFYRLNVLHIHLPPLRERDGDIRFLLDYFLQDYAVRLGKEIQTFSESALDHLLDYPYPGNIRELRNIVEYCANVCRKHTIGRDDLPRYLFDRTPEKSPPATAQGRPAKSSEAEHRTDPPASPLPARGGTGTTWPAIEREMILQALTTGKGNRQKAAEILGWGRTTLWRKIRQYGLG